MAGERTFIRENTNRVLIKEFFIMPKVVPEYKNEARRRIIEVDYAVLSKKLLRHDHLKEIINHEIDGITEVILYAKGNL
jgi:hypothetical protein